MKFQALALFLMCGIFFTACAQIKKTTTSKKKVTPAATASKLQGLSSVMLRRGACFGRCPEYTLTIHSDGLVEYLGTRNATPLGGYQKNFGTDKTNTILQAFMDHQADTCRAYYISRVADAPGMSYTLMYGAKKQLIGNASFGPSYLGELGAEIDALFKVDDSWKKVSEAPIQD
ncbi:MAG: hypothetical protein JST06_02070 [Bacteroidetes bacterium]|nr:hypothetical protein [Bacteroidota bacterium]MBS1630884.1 hypothetical protein [Bacteroidota bacterium]